MPQTGVPIKVFLSRTFALSPRLNNSEHTEVLDSYLWQLSTLDGNRTSFTEAEGKVVLVNFWATWCPPCIAEMPSLQSLYDTFGKDVAFYFVSTETEEILQNFKEKTNYSTPIYTMLTMPPKVLQSKSLPTTYLIDKEGKVIIKKTGAAKWNSDKVKTTIRTLLED